MDHSYFNNAFLKGDYEDLLYLSDAKLFTEDGWCFDVHRVVLAKVNSYFRALFCNADENINTIPVPGVSGRILSLILSYLYSETIQLSNENIQELLIASDYLLIDSLKLRIRDYYIHNISIDNCFPMYMTSLKINYVELVKFIYRYIQTNFQTLMYNDKLNFEEISLETLKGILHDTNLFVKGEDIVWLSIVKWTMIDLPNRLSKLPHLLKCLQIADVDESLASEIIHNDIICKNPLYEKLSDNDQISDSHCSLNILKRVIENSSLHSDPSGYDFKNHRHPKCLRIIIQHRNTDAIDDVKLFLTYDENLDLWRKLGETESCPNFLTVIGHKVYILDYYYNCSKMFDLYEKQWHAMPEPRIQRLQYCAVTVNESIFIIGGMSEETGAAVTDVEFYHTELGMWFDAMPMMPLSECAAVSCEKKIFVVGNTFDEVNQCMLLQVYDVDCNTWSFSEAPITNRFDFALVEYHRKIYVIGGSDGSHLIRNVHVFDLEKESWELISDLPYEFQLTEAIVFDDQLIVFDCYAEDYEKFAESSSPLVSWSEDEKLWKSCDKSLLIKDLNIHLFQSIENKDEISALLKEIRDPAISFVKSPFN